MPTIMPSFDRFPREGNRIGRLLAGYGELELEMCDCVAAATGDLNGAIKKLFGTRGERKRIDIADELMRPCYDSAGLRSKYDGTIENMHWCRAVRNQYAHCNWYDTPGEGLCFIDLEHTATLSEIKKLTEHRRPIDVPLLERQENYFHYVRTCYWHLAEALRIAHGEIVRRPGQAFPWPAPLVRPPKHN
jgi:hypothetical protein